MNSARRILNNKNDDKVQEVFVAMKTKEDDLKDDNDETQENIENCALHMYL